MRLPSTLAILAPPWLGRARPSADSGRSGSLVCGRELRPRVWQLYEQVGRTHLLPALGRIPLANLGPDDLRALHTRMLDAGLSPTTARHAHRVLHRALADAVRWGIAARNVAERATPPRAAQQEMRTLSVEQVQVLLAAARDDRLEALYLLAVTTGMREGELLGLRWRDVDLDRARLSVTATLESAGTNPVLAEPKTAKSRRQIMLTESAVVALRRHRQAQIAEHLTAGPKWGGHDLVFTDGEGQALRRQTVLQFRLRPLLREAGLPPIRFHDLRHTAATLLLSRGVHPKIASEMLGHASVAITLDRYSHVSETMQTEAVKAMTDLLATALQGSAI